MKKIGLKQNFAYNISYEIMRLLVPLITTPYISRVLGSEGIGVYTLSSTYAQYFVLIAGLGFSTYAAREMAYVRDDENEIRKSFWEIFFSRAVLLLAAIIIYYFSFFVFEVKTDVSYKISIIYLIAVLFDFSYYFKALENFRTIAIRNIIIKLFSLFSIFIFVKKSDDVWKYVTIIAIAELIGQFIMVFSLDKSVWRKTKLSWCSIRKHFKISISFFLPTLAIQIYTMLDKLMIGEICGESETGYYENAQKMVRLASTIASAIVSVSAPRMAYYYAKHNQNEFRAHFKKVFDFVSFLVCPMSVGLVVVASNFSSWYYGSNFDGIDLLVRVGSVLIISLGWSGIMGNLILIPTGNQKYYTISVYIAAALNVAMNAILIPQYGALGALIASDAAEILGLILMTYFSNKLYKVLPAMRSCIKYILVSLIMGLVVAIVGSQLTYGVLSTVILVLIGGSVYVIILFFYKDDVLHIAVDTVKRYLVKICGKLGR